MDQTAVAEELDLEITPTGAPLGVFVHGVDAASTEDPRVVVALKKAIADHGCVVLRDQDLDDEATHVRFAEMFGDTVVPWLHAVENNTVARIHELPGRPGYTGVHPGVVYFYNGPQYRDMPDDGYLQGWHADMTHLQVPLPYALLYSLEAPETGYQTWYSNQYLAYDDLDDRTRAQIDDLLISHSFQHVFPNLPPVVHPVALVHPISKRRCIYGIPGVADAHPLGLSKEEADDLMARLTKHLEEEKFVYRHEWRKGDLVIWDNRCVLHRRGPQTKGHTRILRRVMANDGDPHYVRQRLMGYV